MPDENAKRVIVVIGPGRSGTSLLMQTLGTMGMHLSGSMIPGSAANPEGFYEDAEIVEVHKQLLERLSADPTLPLPDGWLDSKAVQEAKGELRNILDERLAETETIWGFKDPRTVAFLPMWIRILNKPGVVPIFILAMRDPAHVAMSLHRQINREQAITEVQWLLRTTDALHHTGAVCCIVHYEDWFARPEELAQGLLTYTGLDQYVRSDVKMTIQDTVKPSLNRAAYDDYTIQNKYVLKLYDRLRECRGADFDRRALMDTVGECRRAMDGFKGWYMQAHKCLTQLNNQRQPKEGKDKLAKLERRGTKELEEITSQENEHLKEIKDLHDEIERLRRTPVQGISQIAEGEELCKQVGQVEKLRTRIEALRSSYSFRIGEVFVNAVAYPGKATFLLPFRFFKIVLEFLVARKAN